MRKNPMDEFHHLVREERYREARGILETADDLDPHTVEKWQHWLAHLHREDRALAGVQSDKAEPQKVASDALQLLMGSVAALTASIITVALLHLALTIPGPFPAFPIFLYSLVAGWFGWAWLTRSIVPDKSYILASIVIIILVFILFFSGIALMAWVAMSLPFNTRMAWLGGEWLGKMIGKRFDAERKHKQT